MRWVEPKRWSPLRALVFVGFCAFALLGWEGVTTVGRLAGDDAWEHLAYAQYLDAHGHLPGKAINYEFASPPLFQATAVAAERLVRHLPSVALEPSWNPLTRILWLALVVGGALALTARRRGPRSRRRRGDRARRSSGHSTRRSRSRGASPGRSGS